MSDDHDELDIERIRRVATEVRAFLEGRWPQVQAANGIQVPQGKPASHEMCRLSSAFLLRVLETEMPETEWLVVGGSPTRDADTNPECPVPGGYRPAGTRRWHGHYWVQDGGYGIVVDVTADQFDGDPVVVTEDDQAYRENYATDAVEDHVRQVRWRVSGWLAEWAEAHAPGWSGDTAFASNGPG